MFLIDILFKGCQGRSNRSSIVHAVSMTPHAFLKIRIPSRIRIIFKKALAPELGAHRTDVLMKKKPRVENLVTLSL
jgi:hypothetical protein